MNLKTADTRTEILDVIRKRWSARSFDGESLTDSQLEAILEAASWAPSAMNEQPWRFVVAKRSDKTSFDSLFSFLLPGNAAWAHAAGALILVLGQARYVYKDRPNVNVLHDCGMATMNLLLQATSMDIYGHVMEGFDKERVKETFGLGDGLVPVTMIALGFLDAPEKLEEPYRTRELTGRIRKPLNEIVWSPDDLS